MQIFYLDLSTLSVKLWDEECKQKKCIHLGHCKGWEEHTYNYNRFKTREEAETALEKIITILKQKDREALPLLP